MFLKMLEYDVSLNAFWSQFSNFEIIQTPKYKEEVKRSNDFRLLIFVIDFNTVSVSLVIFFENTSTTSINFIKLKELRFGRLFSSKIFKLKTHYFLWTNSLKIFYFYFKGWNQPYSGYRLRINKAVTTVTFSI